MLHISIEITITILSIVFLTGCCLGSFADCLAVRLLAGESIVTSRSYCDRCGHVLGFWDLIPLASFFFLKGHCRYCGECIPKETWLTELFTGILACLLVFRLDVSLAAVRGLLLLPVLLSLSLTDLRCFLIPNCFPIAGSLIFLFTGLMEAEPVSFLFSGFILGLVLSGGMLAFSSLFDRISGKESLGGGDIKLFFMTGLYLKSVWELLFFLILSCLFGLLLAAIQRKRRIPFGPAIAAACFFMLLYGEPMTQWYTGLFGI